MRILLTGDFHFDASTAGHPRDEEVLSAVEQMNRSLIDSRTDDEDLYIFLGDLCYPDKGSRTTKALARGMEAFRILNLSGTAGILIAGNHDVIHDSSGVTSLSAIKTAFCYPPAKYSRRYLVDEYDVFPGQVAVAERPTLYSVGEVDVLCLPYVSHVDPYDPEQVVLSVGKWREGTKRPLVVAGHLQLDGAYLGSETTDMSRGRDVAYPVEACRKVGARLMCNGHYHRRQCINGVQCPGSPANLVFGDEEHGSPMWLEVEI